MNGFNSFSSYGSRGFGTGGFGGFGAGRRAYQSMYDQQRQRSQQEDSGLTEEEERSLVSSMRDKTVGGLSAAGNLLDLPGSMVRDVLALKNPLDQLMSPFSAKNRTTGKDLLKQYGLAGRRDSWGKSIAGFGAEVLLDPLTYMTFGGSALSKSGQAAKAAGLMDDVTRVAARKAGRKSGSIGKRQARVTTTLDDFAKYGNAEARAKAQSLINTGKYKADEAVGGMVGFGIPFKDPKFVVGRGKYGQKTAKALDKAGGKVRYAKLPGTDVAPLDATARLFDAALHDTKTKFGQSIARALSREKEKAMAGPRLQAASRANILKDVFDEGAGKYDDSIRDLAEGVLTPEQFKIKFPELKDEQIDAVQDIAAALAEDSVDALSLSKKLGIKVEQLEDDYIQYIARFLSKESGHKARRDRRLISASDPSGQGRIDVFRNVIGGTNAVKQIVKDADINKLIDEGASTEKIAEALKAFYDADIGTKGKFLTDGYKKYKGGKFEDAVGRYDDMAEKLSGFSKETRENGLFGNSVIADHEARMLSHTDAVRSVQVLAEALSEPGVIRYLSDNAANIAAREGKRTKTIGEITSTLNWGDEAQGFGQYLRETMRKSGVLDEADEMSLENLKNLRVDEDIADDLFRIAQTTKDPEAFNELLSIVDDYTNLSKGLWTSVWPAFHVRNLFSGQFQNAMNGSFDPQSARTAFALMKAKPTSGLKDIKAIQDVWVSRGGDAPPGYVPSAVPTPSPTGQPKVVDAGEGFNAIELESIESPLRDATIIAPKQFERLKQLGLTDKQIHQWDATDVNNVIENFGSISENHQKLEYYLKKLEASGNLTKDGANIVRLVYAQSNARALPDSIIGSGEAIVTKEGKKYSTAAGLASYNKGTGASDVYLAKQLGEDDTARVLMHELAHIVFFDAKFGNNAHRNALAKEFNELVSSVPKKDLEQMFSTYNKGNADYYAGLYEPFIISHGENYHLDEVFAETFARQMMNTRVPVGAVGNAIQKAKQWLLDMLKKLKLASGVDPAIRKRIDEITSELAGFGAIDEMAPLPTKPYTPGSSAAKGGGTITSLPPKNPYPARPAKPVVSGELTEKEASKILGELLYAHGVIGKFEGQATDVAGDLASAGTFNDFMQNIIRPDKPTVSARRIAKKAIAREEGTTMNPLDARGVGGKTESSFGPGAAGEELGFFVEGMNRIAPYINMLKRGVDPAEAANRVGMAQIKYSNRYYTPFEQKYMARIMPFYKFSSRVAPYVVKDLVQRPGGRLGTVVKLQSKMQDQDTMAPDYIRETTSIPIGNLLGKVPKGTDRYIAGLGLMHEDPFSFGTGVRSAGLEFLSRTNPVAKAFLETVTGQSFFQKGVTGGRPLEDLDPTVGRLLANITGSEDPVKLPLAIEQILSNSPIARGLSTARSITDPRKRYGDSFIPGPASLINTLTGVRVSDVSPAAKDAILREILQQQEKEAGAKSFQRVYFKKEDLAKMTPEQRREAEQMQKLMDLLAERAKQRKEARLQGRRP